MHAKVYFTLTALLFLTAKGSMEDPGPQSFSSTTVSPLQEPSPLQATPSSLTASPSPHYVMKEVIVYLTPSQIRAIESGHGVLEPVYENQPNPEEGQQNPELVQIQQQQPQLVQIPQQQPQLVQIPQQQPQLVQIPQQHPELVPGPRPNHELIQISQPSPGLVQLPQQNPELLQIPQQHAELLHISNQNPGLVQIPQNNYDNDEEFNKELERQKAYIETQPNKADAIKEIQNQKGETPPPVKEPSREEPQHRPAQFSWYPKEGNNYFTPLTEKPQEYKYYASSTEKPENNRYYAPSTEKPENNDAPSSEKPDPFQPNSYNYFHIYNEKKGDNINIKIFHPAPKDQFRDALDAKELEEQKNEPVIKNYKLVPYEYLRQNPSNYKTNQEQINRIIQKNAERLLFTPAKPEEQLQAQNNEQENSKANEDVDVALLKLKYAAKYNDQAQAIEKENKIKEQKAAAQIEALAKAPPVEVHREVSITKHKPIQVIKHVQVPVPEPYIVRVPEPFEVKVPQPYPVPLEIIRHVPVEIVKTEKVEVEKPVPYEVEKHVAVPVTKKVYVKVDKPYFVEKMVPVEIRKEIPVKIPIRKPQKFTIIRHVWEHK